MDTGMVIYTIVTVLAGLMALAGIYFVIYQRHINKVLKDPDNAKKSHIRLPSIGTSYTGMWFVAWLISVVIILVMMMDVLSVVRRNAIYAESNAEMQNYIEEEVLDNKEKLDSIYDEILNDRYISEKNTKFELGNFDAEKNTIDLKVTVNDINMSENDTVKWRMNGRTLDLTQDMAKKQFTGVIKMDIMEFDIDYTLDSVFISEVDGVKRVDRIYKYNRYYQDSDFGIEFSNNYHFLPEGDFKEYWEDYFPAVDATLAYNDGYDVSYNDGKLKFDTNIYFDFYQETKVKDRKIISGKAVVYINGKNVYEEKINPQKAYDAAAEEETYSLHINKLFDLKNDSTLDMMFEYEDNYGYTYSKRIWTQESPFERTSMDDYVIKNKNGDIVYIQKAE